jgi:flavin reductase (DIM6/NTAB) family NADH-FMN oxidoreductase RutF
VECRVVSDFFAEGLHLFVGEALAVHLDHQLAPVVDWPAKTIGSASRFRSADANYETAD